jgi:hypothetical protein
LTSLFPAAARRRIKYDYLAALPELHFEYFIEEIRCDLHMRFCAVEAGIVASELAFFN